MSHLKDLIFSIDIGTTSLKIGIFTQDTQLVSFRRYTYEKCDLSWTNLEFFHDFDEFLPCISTISISAQSPSIIPLLNNNTVGHPVFYFEDKKMPLAAHTSVFLPQVAYLKYSYPEEYMCTLCYLSLGDYLVYLLTKKTWTSLPQSAYQAAVWDSHQIEAYGLEKEKFPDYLIWPAIAGVTKGGLPCPAGITVLASNYDFLSAILGLDALQLNIASDRGGSSLGLNFFFRVQDMEKVQAQRPFPEFDWHIYPQLDPGTFNAGVIFPDFHDFLVLLHNEINKDAHEKVPFEGQKMLEKILPLINQSSLKEKPAHISQSFLVLWNSFDEKDNLTRAAKVFTNYGQILRTILQDWPVERITEVRASGGPNENESFIQFKQKASGIPWKSSRVLYAELLGNVVAVQRLNSSKK